MENIVNSFNNHNKSKRHNDTSTTIRNFSKANVQKLLELLNTVSDVEMHAKIFSILTTELMSNNDCSDIIITCNYMYYKILKLLNKRQPIRTAKILYFLSALLYVEEEEASTRKKSLVIYAQNMIRNSGCLLYMCNLFISSMIHQETWRALCRCLAEACQNSYENQTYCSHLVPLSVEKCIQGDVEVILTIKNLITNHNRNMRLFLECNGLTIFNKEFLRYDTSMQLLDLLAQKLPIETLHALHEIVYEVLIYFKTESYDTQIGQWATLILYHMNCRLKGFNEAKKYGNKSHNNTLRQSSVTSFKRPHLGETAQLLQNVIKEIYYLNSNNVKLNNSITKRVMNFQSQQPIRNQSGFTGKQRNTCSQSNIINNHAKQIRTIKETESSSNDLSFSFLLKQQLHDSSLRDNNKTMIISAQQIPDNMFKHSSQYRKKVSKNNTLLMFNNSTHQNKDYGHKCNDTEIKDFKPTFASTPNQSKYFENITFNSSKMSKLNSLSRQKFKRANSSKNYRKLACRYENEKYKQDSIQHRTISTRFFDAINDSCTTIVKTVKNIFRPKKVVEETINAQSSNVNKVEPPVNYSFTEYMRKRDAVLSDQVIETESINVESCKTCNDTIILKRKLEKDDFLKKTIKKLKLGINLYGCDFKKISRIMWPRENYMTPEVLYNLYRRVILK